MQCFKSADKIKRKTELRGDNRLVKTSAEDVGIVAAIMPSHATGNWYTISIIFFALQSSGPTREAFEVMIDKFGRFFKSGYKCTGI